MHEQGGQSTEKSYLAGFLSNKSMCYESHWGESTTRAQNRKEGIDLGLCHSSWLSEHPREPLLLFISPRDHFTTGTNIQDAKDFQ